MKKLLKQFSLVFVSAILLLGACKKNSEEAVTKTPGIENLAKQFGQPISSNSNSLISQYKNLSQKEAVAFWVQVNRNNHAPAKLSAIEENIFTNKIEQYFKKSDELYNKPFNKLDPKEFQEIIGYKRPLETEVNSITKIPPPPPTGCEYYTYPLQFFSGNIGPFSPPSAPYYTVKIGYYSVDCQAYEFPYLGVTWGSMHALTPQGAIALSNSPFLVRIAGGYTRVYAPKDFVDAFLGGAEGFNIHLTVAGQPI